MTKNILLIGLVLLIGLLIVVLMRQPKPTLPDNQAKIDSITTVNIILSDSLVLLKARLKKSHTDDSLSQTRFKADLTRLQKTVTQLRQNPEVVTIIEQNPAIARVIVIQDSIINRQSDRIQEQGAKLVEQAAINEQMVGNLEKQLAGEAVKFAESQATIAILQDDNRKFRRQKAVAIIGAVGAFVLGVIVN